MIELDIRVLRQLDRLAGACMAFCEDLGSLGTIFDNSQSYRYTNLYRQGGT